MSATCVVPTFVRVLFCCLRQLTRKHNAKVPLPEYTGSGPWAHPYYTEITTLDFEAWMLAPNAEAPFATMDATPFHFVDTPAAFDMLLSHLESPEVKELAIDLEAHNQHSYHGFSCLMQVCSVEWVVTGVACRGACATCVSHDKLLP